MAKNEPATREADRRSLTIPMPPMPRLGQPDGRDLMMYGGVATLALLTVIDWPVAAVAAAAYALARNGQNGTTNGGTSKD